MATPALPWNVETFRAQRPSLTRFVDRKIIRAVVECHVRRVVIHAPVKSGKREMVEYISQKLPEYEHVFLSAFHRLADECQRDEMTNLYNIKVYSGLSERKTSDYVIVQQFIEATKPVMIHLDECDYGTAKDQVLSKIWKVIYNNPNVRTILYSATPTEVHVAGCEENTIPDLHDSVLQNGDRKVICLNYTPPKAFCGPTKFLEQNLIQEAFPFFAGSSLTEHGKEIWGDFIQNLSVDPKRNVFVLRLTGGGRVTDHKEIYKFMDNIHLMQDLFCAGKRLYVYISVSNTKGFKRYKPQHKAYGVTCETPIRWSDEDFWDFEVPLDGQPKLIILDQTSTRSTEWKCHDRVYAYHDFRNTITFSTISQAQERVNHYVGGRYKEFNPIKVYGYKKSWLLSAGLIDYHTFLARDWAMRKINKSDPPVYKIHKVGDTEVRNTNYPELYSKEEATDILDMLGCSEKSKLSSRVEAKSYERYIVNCEFYPCNAETFDKVVPIEYTIGRQNPFLRPHGYNADTDTYLCSTRGSGTTRLWKKQTFDEFVQNRHDQCRRPNEARFDCVYKDGVLGVGFKYRTNFTERVQCFKHVSSMYEDYMFSDED